MEKFIEYFLRYMTVERGLSKNTVRSYKFDLDALAFYLNERGITAWDQADRDMLLDFLDALRDCDMETTSIARHIASMRMFYRYLASEELVKTDPTLLLDTPKLWRVLPDYLSLSEVDALLNIYPENSEDPLDLRNRTLLYLLYATGMRVSELISVKLADINFENSMLRIIGKGSKERIVPIAPYVMRLLDRYIRTARECLIYLSPKSPLLFLSNRSKKLNRERVWAVIKDAAWLAGISKNIHPHTLRHSFASHLLANGADLRVIQEMLGHADIGTTEVYTHVDSGRFGQLHQKFHPRG
jgi:integrase/recombinase XerD